MSSQLQLGLAMIVSVQKICSCSSLQADNEQERC